jgi:hypothetical protein
LYGDSCALARETIPAIIKVRYIKNLEVFIFLRLRLI